MNIYGTKFPLRTAQLSQVEDLFKSLVIVLLKKSASFREAAV